MAGWWCGRCRSDVDKRRRQPCKCTSGPSPWWYVPTTIWEKLRCALGRCWHDLGCARCNPPPHYRK